MYEVILTFRPDFSETALDRYATAEEAQSAARAISVHYHDRVIRVWVRHIREAETSSELP